MADREAPDTPGSALGSERIVRLPLGEEGVTPCMCTHPVPKNRPDYGTPASRGNAGPLTLPRQRCETGRKESSVRPKWIVNAFRIDARPSHGEGGRIMLPIASAYNNGAEIVALLASPVHRFLGRPADGPAPAPPG